MASDGGWTLIARFSNADAKNWVFSNASYWYDQLETGSPLSTSTNADMISKAFYTVSGTSLKLTKSDDSNHNGRMYIPACLYSKTFRELLAGHGNYRYNSHEYIFTTMGSLSHN